MIHITDDFITSKMDYPKLIHALKLAFRRNDIQCPPKLSYDYQSDTSQMKNKMMLMPAWDNQCYFGIKIISATPENHTTEHAYLNGTYQLFDAQNGIPIAMMDAKLLTHIRTAATSVLATTYLAREDASSVLIIGNGNIAPHYIEAYASLENVNQIYVWGRRHEKTVELVNGCKDFDCKVTALKDFDDSIQEADIVSCISSAESPIVLGKHMGSGQHFDLAGSYTTTMIEMSVAAVGQCSVYVDNMEVTPFHAGEIQQAIQRGEMTIDDIKGSLHDLCVDDEIKRKETDNYTLFKSTGMGLEDLVLATLLYEEYIQASI